MDQDAGITRVLELRYLLKVWWVTQYEFCCKFTAVCSSERILQIDQELTKL